MTDTPFSIPEEDNDFLVLTAPNEVIYRYACGGQDPCTCMNIRLTRVLHPFVLVNAEGANLDEINQRGLLHFRGTLDGCVEFIQNRVN